jgi:hypothetical protein
MVAVDAKHKLIVEQAGTNEVVDKHVRGWFQGVRLGANAPYFAKPLRRAQQIIGVRLQEAVARTLHESWLEIAEV